MTGFSIIVIVVVIIIGFVVVVIIKYVREYFPLLLYKTDNTKIVVKDRLILYITYEYK